MSTLKHKTINDIIVKKNVMSITVSQYFQKKIIRGRLLLSVIDN